MSKIQTKIEENSNNLYSHRNNRSLANNDDLLNFAKFNELKIIHSSNLKKSRINNQDKI